MLKWLDILQFAAKGNPEPPARVERTDEEWQSLLTPEEYRVMRLKGTERAFTGEYCEAFEAGKYACKGCDTLMFDSEEKFESGTGWPSFTQPAEIDAVKYIKDKSFGMIRVEIMCNICDSHLGHVFNDGPGKSGLRYCVNSISLKKIS